MNPTETAAGTTDDTESTADMSEMNTEISSRALKYNGTFGWNRNKCRDKPSDSSPADITNEVLHVHF